MELKLVLKDGTEIELKDAGYAKHFVVVCEDNSAFQEIWNKLTKDNLSEVQITEDGNTVQIVTGLTLNGTQTITNPDGTVTGHFYLDGGEYVRLGDEYSEAAKILLGEEE